jgi:hypothetical protein
MVAGHGRRVAGFTFKDSDMVKLGGRPTICNVAAQAIAAEMVGVEAVGGQLVTTVAGGAGLPVTTVVMAGETVQIGVAASQGEQIMVDGQPQKRDQLPRQANGH